ncbi:MAG: ATP-dependent sacrificial sulfur transferase LarE [Planctomycetota bacterium]
MTGYVISTDPTELLARLEDAIRPRRRLMTAYSGGIDSTLVAVTAHRVLGPRCALAVIGDSPSLPRFELEQAVALAEDLGLSLRVVRPNEQQDPGYQANAGDRCYFCKTHLYRTLHRTARDLGFDAIANGTNTDDLGDHRPGLTAADEAQVVSPLLDAGLGKQQVRELARLLALPNADKPAAACLASRIPYGTSVTIERLAQVEQAEDALRALGLTGLRVRHHGQVARIELPLDQMPTIMDDVVRDRAVAAIKAAGFSFVSLDLEGFRSGSGNVLLTIGGTHA